MCIRDRDVTLFHFPKHAVAQRGWRKSGKPTVGFKSLPTWTPTPHNVDFAERAYSNFGKSYGEFIAAMRAGYGHRMTGEDYRRLAAAKHAAAADSIASMRDQVGRSGRAVGGYGGRIPGGFVEETPAWYDRGGRY